VAVGNGGAWYTWDGGQWSEQSYGVNTGLMAVSGVDAETVAAGGIGGRFTRWDGSRWSVEPADEDHYFWDFWMAGEDELYAVELNDSAGWQMLKFRGSSWDTLPWGPSQASLAGVWGAGSDDVYFIGAQSARLMLAHWDGQTVTVEAGPEIPPAATLESLTGCRPSALFAVCSNTTFKWDGTEWTDLEPPGSLQWRDGWAVSAHELYLVGAQGRASRWDGTAWTLFDMDLHAQLNGVWASSANDVFAVGNGALAHFDGTSWTVTETGNVRGFHNVWGAETGEVFAVGDNGEIMRWSGPSPSMRVAVYLPAYISSGGMFSVMGELINPGPAVADAAVFFILDVYGELWFWNDWTYCNPPAATDIDYVTMTVPSGTTPITVVPEFPWPDTGSAEAAGLWFHGGMVNLATNEL